jgi:hypothetical protein
MTQADWWACGDPQEMLAFLKTSGLLTDRKARLFAVACCRRVWHLMRDERSRQAVDVSEGLADDLVHEEAWQPAADAAIVALVAASEAYAASAATADMAAHAAASCAADAIMAVTSVDWEAGPALHVEAQSAAGGACHAAASAVDSASADTSHSAWFAECAAQASLLRCIVGNPLRPRLVIDCNTLTQHVLAVAHTAYADQLLPSGHLDPARLAVLAQALQDAGCTDAELLGHLRREGPHVRGCFAVDALLGKE